MLSGVLRDPYCKARLALQEMGAPSLLDALDYLQLLAEVSPEELESGGGALV